MFYQSSIWGISRKIFEPVHDKTYNKTSATSKDSDQPVYPPSSTRVLVCPSFGSQEAVYKAHVIREDWSDCVDAQADKSLCWSHKSY